MHKFVIPFLSVLAGLSMPKQWIRRWGLLEMDHAAHMSMMATRKRRAEEVISGKDVIPFTLAATTHTLYQGRRGRAACSVEPFHYRQVKLVRQHLQKSVSSF
jgi:hypothetical protein